MGSVISSDNIPKDIQNASMSIALLKTCFEAGETITGYIDVVIKAPIKCQQIGIEMKGETYTTVHYTTHSGSGKHRRTVSFDYFVN
jgi:hypothetical protein